MFRTIEVRYSAEFGKWLNRLRDANAYATIVQRVRRLERGNPGDVKSVGGGLHELRIDYGPGYRVYFIHEVLAVVILLSEATRARRTGTSRGRGTWPENRSAYDGNHAF